MTRACKVRFYGIFSIKLSRRKICSFPSCVPHTSHSHQIELTSFGNFPLGLRTLLLKIFFQFDEKHFASQIIMSDSGTLVRNMSRSGPRFNLAGLHSTQPLTLQVYAFNNKGRSETVIVRERIIITAEIGSQSTGVFNN